jgi:hypothetical protein
MKKKECVKFITKMKKLGKRKVNNHKRNVSLLVHIDILFHLHNTQKKTESIKKYPSYEHAVLHITVQYHTNEMCNNKNKSLS